MISIKQIVSNDGYDINSTSNYYNLERFCSNGNFLINDKFILINDNFEDQIGGNIKTYSVIYHDRSYSFDYYKNVSDTVVLIYIRIGSTEKNITEFDTNYHCGVLSFEKQNPTVLNISILNYSNDCIKTSTDRSTKKIKLNGSLLVKLIIKFAKENGFVQITLEDD